MRKYLSQRLFVVRSQANVSELLHKINHSTAQKRKTILLRAQRLLLGTRAGGVHRKLESQAPKLTRSMTSHHLPGLNQTQLDDLSLTPDSESPLETEL